MTQDTVVDGPGSGLQKGRAIDSDLLRNIESLDDAIAVANQTYDNFLDASREIGDGFALLKSKDNLIEVPCLFLSWEFNKGDYGDVFVSARVVTQAQDGSAQKFILNDGSTGICKQLKELTETTGQYGGLLAKNGLRRSDYPKIDDKGNEYTATTYYIDTSA